MIRLLWALGIVLLLGALAHSAGVANLYATKGVPDANRVLLDVWIAQAQLLAGGLYIAAARSARAGRPWQSLATFGALTMIGFSIAIVPVLIARAPIIFRVPPIVYSIGSVVVLVNAARSR
ncbi:MAG TPA: hypothetical protein VGY57_03115 [Vicinamibacterales bacterium]|jgi:hypothetical protein|nr:hypothetical protein [Vicinamibacterales bacterium]